MVVLHFALCVLPIVVADVGEDDELIAFADIAGDRDRLGIEAGDRLEFVESEQGFLVVAATRDIRSLKGIVGRPKKPVTIEEMNSTIEKMGRMP
jgi:antitoxin PrlF